MRECNGEEGGYEKKKGKFLLYPGEKITFLKNRDRGKDIIVWTNTHP